MFGIKANDRFLDTKPGSSTEIERKSPFFTIDDIVSEATTSTIEFPYTPNNALALGLPYQYYTLRGKKKIQVEHYDGNSFRGICTLVIETAKLDLNNIESGVISGYLLYGISHFLQEIKDKKLSDLELGGERTFAFTTYDTADGSNGFWQHIHATWTDNTIPYVFAPVRNETWLEDSVEWMNGLGTDGKIKNDPITNPLVPFIRLPYLLEQIFVEMGWAVDFTGLNDTDWQKLVLLSIKQLAWYTAGYSYDTGTGQWIPAYTTTTVKFKLGDFVPQQKKITDFIIQLFNRYGWAPVFNLVNKKCRFISVKDLSNGPVVDWTKYADPLLDSSFNQDEKLFAFTNEIDSNDTFPSAPDFTGKVIGPSAVSVRYLPNPSPLELGTIRFCYLQNQWYIASLDEVLNEYQWKVFADNIHNEEPEGATDTFNTTISTLPIYLTRYREASGVDYYAYFPFMKQSRDTEFGYRLLFYHGVQREITETGFPGIIDIPMTSPILVDNVGDAVMAWSNVYEHRYFENTVFEQDHGIIAYWWKGFLDILKNGEELQAVFRLPLYELYRFSWEMVILIRNIPYLVKSLVQPMPYTGFVQATLKRLVTVQQVIDAGLAAQIYAKSEVVNIVSDYGGTGPGGEWTNYRSCDVVISLFSDAAGTIPYTPASPLAVVVSFDGHYDSTSGPTLITTATTFSITSDEQTVYTRAMYDGNQSTDGRYFVFNYILLPDPNGVYTVI